MPEAPSGSSFEADLRALREDRGLSISDIERATRVPADVVRRFEDGALMRDPDYSVVYLRAFVKAYAEALDLSTSRTNAAFDAARQGTYGGELRTELDETEAPAEASESPDLPPPAQTPPASTKESPSKQAASSKSTASKSAASKASASKPAPSSEAAATKSKKEASDPPKTAKEAPPETPASSAAPAVAALSQAEPKERKAHTPTPPPRRSGTPSRVGTTERRSWGLLVGIAALSFVALAVVFFLIFRDPGPDLEPVSTTTATDTTATSDSTAAAPQTTAPPAPQVGDTIRVTVIAADGPLRDFRVQESPDVRRPYWMEQGTEETFTSTEEVVVWGIETADGWGIDPEARLRIEGLTWTPSGQVVRLDRARAQAVVDSLHRAQYGG
jgi:cytoskeletal protein RodZ